MPKMKSKRGLRLRFRVTAKGKVMRSRTLRRHILTSKNRNKKRAMRRPAVVHRTEARTIKRLLLS